MVWVSFLLLVIGFLLLMKGADFLVDGASGIAIKLGIPQIVVGLTIVAMGTSAPEAAVSITSALKDNVGIAIGNVLGSNILNILIILGITAVIKPLPIQKNTIKYEMPFLIIISSLFAFLGLHDYTIDRMNALILLGLFLIYLIYNFQISKSMNDEEEEETKSIPLLFLLFIIGIVMVVFGSDITVDAATDIARTLGMSERFIGLTIVALGTSLPELVTSTVAAVKGKTDLAIGNIVGSNIFNILFVIGVSSFITPIIYASTFFIDSLICIGAALLLFLLVFKEKKLTRASGIILLLGYIGYFIYLIH